MTRAKGQWRIVPRLGRRLEKVTVTDWDGNGRADDVLLLLDGRTVEWWQRDSQGYIRLRVRQRLPDNFVPSESASSNSTGWIWTKADMNGDRSLDQVQILPLLLTQWLPQGFVTPSKCSLNRITFPNGQIHTLRCPNVLPNAVTVRDFDGDGQAEIWVAQLDGHRRQIKLTCWRYDPTNRHFVIAFRTQVRRPED